MTERRRKFQTTGRSREDDLVALALTSVPSMGSSSMKPTAMETPSVGTMEPSAMEKRMGSGMESADRA
jgi:hypothetical protein